MHQSQIAESIGHVNVNAHGLLDCSILLVDESVNVCSCQQSAVIQHQKIVYMKEHLHQGSNLDDAAPFHLNVYSYIPSRGLEALLKGDCFRGSFQRWATPLHALIACGHTPSYLVHGYLLRDAGGHMVLSKT